MNAVENTFLPAPVTAADISQFKTAAARAYGNAKSSAMESAANAYLVWYHGQSEAAEPHVRDWLDEEIKKVNAKIDAHNKAMDHKKTRAKLCKKNELNEPISDAEKADLLELSEWKTSEWAKKKQVKIDACTRSTTYSRIVKFVFGFKKPSEASHVSRYAKVLEFIEINKHELNGDFSVEAIVRLLDKSGGFEAAVEAMRNSSSASSDNVRTATLIKIKQAVDNIDTGNEIVFVPKHQQDGYVFLVGRTTATGVMVCGELAINDNEEAEALLLKINGDVMGDPQPAVAFAARIASIARLVGEGRASHIIDHAGTGEAFKVQRAFSLVESNGSTHLVISARYAEASVIVHAVPKGSVDIGVIAHGHAAMLDGAAARDFMKVFGDEARCRLLEIAAAKGDDATPVNWTVSIDNAGSPPQNFAWNSMFGVGNLPLNLRGFAPDCEITLFEADIRDLYDAYLAKWSKAKTDDKDVRKPLTVSFDGTKLDVGHKAYGTHRIALKDKQKAQVSLLVRPRDMVDLFKKLLELGVQHCTLSGDNYGMVAMRWEDAVGIYTVHIPALDARGSLRDSCIGSIKPTR